MKLTKRNMNSTPLLLLLPILALIAVMAVLPMVYLITVSFHETSYLNVLRYVGISNYRHVISDPRAVRSILVSLEYIFGTLLLSIPLGLVLALVLYRPLKFKTLFKGLLILPYAVSQVTAAMLWSLMLQPGYGPVNYIVGKLGFQTINFLGNPGTAVVVLILVNSWMSFPFAMVLCLAARETIPIDLYEAAVLDGAAGWTGFLYITLPLMLNTVLVVVIMTTLRTFNMVTLIYVLTGGGPIYATSTLSLKIFYAAFTNLRIAQACVEGLIMFVMNVLFAGAYVAVLRREVVY